MTETRVLIVEDEPPARAKLKRLLAAHAGFRVVAEADTVGAGLAALREHAPDLLFLDIALGAGNGFDVLARATPPYPLTVFTTAFQQHALRAFEFAALDYLLKPFDRERFDAAMRRVAERLAERRRGRMLDESGLDAGGLDDERLRRARELTRLPALTRLVAHERGRSVVVPLADVQRLSAAGNYVEIYTSTRRHLIRAGLARLAQRLDPAVFLRVHRSHLVRAAAIAEILPRAHGDALLRLRDGSELMLSRRYRAQLPEGALPE